MNQKHDLETSKSLRCLFLYSSFFMLIKCGCFISTETRLILREFETLTDYMFCNNAYFDICIFWNDVNISLEQIFYFDRFFNKSLNDLR